MNEVLKALQELNVCWKKIGHYNMKCRWVPGFSDGQNTMGNDQIHFRDESSIIEDDCAMTSLTVIKFELQVTPTSLIFRNLLCKTKLARTQTKPFCKTWINYCRTTMFTYIVAHTCINFYWIKLLILKQLYKAREEKYLLDIQRVNGPQFLFLDLCAAFLTELRVIWSF